MEQNEFTPTKGGPRPTRFDAHGSISKLGMLDMHWRSLNEPQPSPPAATPEPVGAGEAAGIALIEAALRQIRAYFGEHDKTGAEHHMYAVADRALSTLTATTAHREQQVREAFQGLLEDIGHDGKMARRVIDAGEGAQTFDEARVKAIHEAAASLGLDLNA